jgi:hypothetical protein
MGSTLRTFSVFCRISRPAKRKTAAASPR